MFSLKKILVVGSANVDFVIGVRQAPELGETILCRSFRKTCGGKGANQAYACGRLGGDTAFLNAVGDDPLGGELVRNLQQANVDTRAIRTVDGVSTGMAVVCVDEKGNNSIIVIPGANNLCDVDYLRRNRARFEESDIVLLQMEIPFESVCYAVELASGLHKTVILNPAPAPDSLPDEVYAGLDYLTPNESEFKRLTGCPTDEVEELAVHCKPLLERDAEYHHYAGKPRCPACQPGGAYALPPARGTGGGYHSGRRHLQRGAGPGAGGRPLHGGGDRLRQYGVRPGGVQGRGTGFYPIV